MTQKLKKLAISLLAAIFFFACSEDKYMGDYEYLNSDTEISVALNEETFVSLEQATAVAEKFFGVEAAKKGSAKSLVNASVEAVIDKGNTSMYVVNYPEGGWVIVGASKNYYPILAYSDEGRFELKADDEMGGVIVWLQETQVAVRESATFADSTKTQMRRLWQAYEKKAESSGAKSQQDMDDRIRSLNRTYGSSGWHFSSLYDAQWDLDSYSYQEILNMSYNYGYPQYTIVGLKSPSTGPLMTTQWHQAYPFNAHVVEYEVTNTLAGCGPVAMAQIMKYHGKPTGLTPSVFPDYTHYSWFDSIGWSNVFNWSNMPNHASQTTSSNSTHYLIHAAGRAASASYSTVFTGVNINNVEYALKNVFGYLSVTKATHTSGSISTIKSSIISLGKPVYMQGVCSINGGHAWVCDGVKEYNTLWCAEFYDGNGGYNDYNWRTPNYPGSNGYTAYYLHMNWCFDYYYDAWYINNNVNPGGSNYQNDRENLYIYY